MSTDRQPRRFAGYCREKEEPRGGTAARLPPCSEEAGGVDLLAFGSAWTRTLFDGDFHRSAGPRSPDLPAVTLVHDWPPDDPRGEGAPGPVATPRRRT